MGRAPCCDKANVKRGPWSPEEDHKLKSYIDKHGTGGNWIALPQKIGLKRCGKSCRLRWLNYLRPNIKHGGFTPDEDDLICTLYITIGSRWSIIAAQLPGRTDNDIKNYWNTRLKKKLLGKQRREQRDQMKKLGVSTNYSIINNSNCFSSLYPRPPLQVVAAPPLLEVAAGDYSALIMPTSTTLDHATFPYEPINIGGIYDNYSTYFSTSSDFNVQPNDFQSFNEIVSEDFPFYSTPRKLEGADSLSAVELVNSGNASSISSEIISGTVSSWGDNNNNNNIGCCLANDNNNPFSQSYYYQVSQRRLPENNDVFLIN